MAEATEVVLFVGAPVRLASGLHIGAFVIEPDRGMGVYTKRYPAAGEEAVFVPGNLDPILELGDDRAACAICADTSHPEHAEAAAKRSANLYLVGAFFDPEGYPFSVRRLAGYAARHAIAVVLANSGGPATDFPSAGGSAVWSDSGGLVARLPGVGAGLVIAKKTAGGWSGETVLL